MAVKHIASCTQRLSDVNKVHKVVTDCSKRFSDDPGKTVGYHEIHLKPGSRHNKSPHHINTEKSSLAAPTSATVLLYHIVVYMLHMLADLLKEIDSLE